MEQTTITHGPDGQNQWTRSVLVFALHQQSVASAWGAEWKAITHAVLIVQLAAVFVIGYMNGGSAGLPFGSLAASWYVAAVVGYRLAWKEEIRRGESVVLQKMLRHVRDEDGR